MHASSLENMQRCFQRHVAPSPLARQDAVLVVDVGGADVNGSYREIFSAPQYRYLTVDLAAGEGVDLALDDPYRLPFDDDSVDIVVSGQMLEHCEFFWRTFGELVRVLKPGGLLILIAPSGGPIHRYPVDCYRFYPDAYRALAKTAPCELLEVWQDDRGPWRDLVGVFRKHGAARQAALPQGSAADAACYEEACRHLDGGDLGGGAALLIELAESASAMWQPYWRLAGVALDQGDTVAAGDLLLAAIERAPDEPQPSLDLARLHDTAGDLDGALDRLGCVLSRTPGHGEASELLRRILARAGELPPAIWQRLLADLRQAPRDTDPSASGRTARSLALVKPRAPANPPPPYDPLRSPPGSAAEEATRGQMPYLEALDHLQRALAPSYYLEIGVRNGGSLKLARCPAVGVDPAPAVADGTLPATAKIHVGTSDDYFLNAPEATRAPDLAFIDGMHLFEFALRDFMNIELNSAGHTVVVVDDIYPSHPAQAARQRCTRVWTGDVWKLYRCLTEWRPDLQLIALDTAPTGLLLICGLDRDNTVLRDNYNPIVRQYVEQETVPADILQRTGALRPGAALIETLADAVRTRRGAAPATIADALREIDWFSLPTSGADMRPFASALTPALASSIQHGVMNSRYKGIRFLKSPFDIVIYMHLLDTVRPATIIEIGAFEGGSAVWFADQMETRGIAPRVVSIDLKIPVTITDPRVESIAANALDLAAALPAARLAALPRPWLVIEDSAHTREVSLAVLDFFDRWLRAGDYIVIEDGVVRTLPETHYRQYNDGPCRAVHDFLQGRTDRFEIDRACCDYFGQNLTWNPGGYLRRTKD